MICSYVHTHTHARAHTHAHTHTHVHACALAICLLCAGACRQPPAAQPAAPASLQQSAEAGSRATGSSAPGAIAACDCPVVYSPLCCNGSTFMSSCTARCLGGLPDLSDCYTGACPRIPAPVPPANATGPKPCLCARLYNPVCCNGVEYENGCRSVCADAAQSLCRAGRCPKARAPVDEPLAATAPSPAVVTDPRPAGQALPQQQCASSIPQGACPPGVALPMPSQAAAPSRVAVTGDGIADTKQQGGTPLA
jgi:hypothetical protein